MKTGTLEVIRRLHCPYCGNTEDADELEQYESFEFLKVDEGGIVHTWKCRCGEQFKIYFA